MIFSTYASARRVAEALRGAGRVLDLLVADEAHRLAGWGSRPWGMPLNDSELPARYRLHLTATPRIHRGDDQRSLVASMDDEALFGPVAYRLTFAQAIGRGLLSEYQVVVVAVTRADILARLHRESGTDAYRIRNDDTETARDLAILMAIERWQLRSMLIFTNRVTASEDLVTHLRHTHEQLQHINPAWPDIRADHLDAGSSAARRRLVLEQLREPGDIPTIVSNVKLLGEGVDVPALDAVMFAEPRSSTIDVVQSVGRALRLGRSGVDQPATILIPLWIAAGESAEAAIVGSRYDTIQRILTAIGDHDDRIFDDIGTRWSPRDEPGSRPERLRVVGAQLEDVAELADALTMRVMDQTGLKLSALYARVAAYAASHGTADVPKRATDDHGNLGAHVTYVRRQRSRIPAVWVEKFARLSGWRWDRTRHRWTPEEDAAIADSSRSIADLVQTLGRSRGQISVRRSELNKRQTGQLRMPRWTDAERAVLLDTTISNQDAARILGRTGKGVQAQRAILGVTKSRRSWTSEQDQQILASKVPVAELAASMDKTPREIYNRRGHLRRTDK